MTSANLFINFCQKKKQLTYYVVYTLIFGFTSIFVFSWFYLNRKSFIWKPDGLEGTLNSLIYFGRYLRQIVYNFINTGKITIPMFDFSLGYGEDIITTLHWGIIGDPLHLFFVFIPSSKTEYFYCFLVIFRLYLSGIAFSAYCKKINKPRFTGLCGSLMYTFCGYALFASVRHPYFINPMIYFPLLLIGIEEIFENKKPYLFIVMVFLSAVSSFYFFYMLSVLMVIYAAIRFFLFYNIKNLLKYLGKFSLYYGTGLLMACILFVPVLMLTFSSTRFSIRPIVDILYPKNYYINFPASFITNKTPGSWTYLGYSGISFVAVILFLFKKKTNTNIKILFILFTFFLMLPIMGHILHGFSYVTNRWIWGYSFIVALITTIMIPDIMKPTKNQLVIVSLLMVLYLYYCVCIGNASSGVFFKPFAIIFLLVIFMYCVYIKNIYDNKNILIRNSPKIVVLALIIFNIILQAGYFYSPRYGNYVNQFTGLMEAYDILSGYPSRAVKEVNDKSFYRFDEHISNVIRNHSVTNKENSTSSYFSLSNPVIYDFFINDIDLFVTTSNNYIRLDNRAIICALAGIKYFVVNSGAEQYLPYGFDRLVHTSGNNLVYENANFLPFGFTYSNFITETEYKNLSAIEKQQALLMGGGVLQVVRIINLTALIRCLITQ